MIPIDKNTQWMREYRIDDKKFMAPFIHATHFIEREKKNFFFW